MPSVAPSAGLLGLLRLRAELRSSRALNGGGATQAPPSFSRASAVPRAATGPHTLPDSCRRAHKAPRVPTSVLRCVRGSLLLHSRRDAAAPRGPERRTRPCPPAAAPGSERCRRLLPARRPRSGSRPGSGRERRVPAELRPVWPVAAPQRGAGSGPHGPVLLRASLGPSCGSSRTGAASAPPRVGGPGGHTPLPRPRGSRGHRVVRSAASAAPGKGNARTRTQVRGRSRGPGRRGAPGGAGPGGERRLTLEPPAAAPPAHPTPQPRRRAVPSPAAQRPGPR